jgi:hypothetical protein
MDSSIQKKRPVNTLTHDNWEEWFYLFKEWAKGEGMDFVLQKTAQQYALQGTQPFAGFGTGTTPSSSNPGTPAPIDIPPHLLDI